MGRHLAAFVAACALGWALVLASGLDGVSPGDLKLSMDAKGGKVELAREVGGLVFVFLGMLIVREADRRARNQRAKEADWTSD